MTAYYNEIDPFAAGWLRNLIEAGEIAPGTVDTRSIRDVLPSDLEGHTQCHFFAGIGGWSAAARLAGWPDARPVWTGSCPCQPFSAAGKQGGTADERHLWPEFLRLIAQCRPAVVFGEQVASRLGRDWLSGVRADLEALAYAVGAADLCAAGVGAPHIRQRLYWVADASGARVRDQGHRQDAAAESGAKGAGHDGDGVDRLADADGGRPGARRGDDGQVRSLQEAQRQPELGATVPGRGGPSGRLADAAGERLEGHAGHGDDGDQPGRQREVEARPAWTSGGAGFWSDYDLVPCSDGKARRTQPGIFPLAHGVPNRVGLLRGAGNAIVPQVAALFILAWSN